MVEGFGKLQMQAPVLLHIPVLHRLSSHVNEFTVNDPRNSESVTICRSSIPMYISSRLCLCKRGREGVEIVLSHFCLYLVIKMRKITDRVLGFKQRYREREISFAVSCNSKGKEWKGTLKLSKGIFS